MPLRLADSYLRGRLARRLLLVFVLASLVPVLLASVLSYRQLVRGADAARARALHNEAKESALTFLSQLQAASTELALFDPAGSDSRDSGHPWPPAFTAISFEPVGTHAPAADPLPAGPSRCAASTMRGRD